MERPEGSADNYDNAGDNAGTWVKNIRLPSFCYDSNVERLVSGQREYLRGNTENNSTILTVHDYTRVITSTAVGSTAQGFI